MNYVKDLAQALAHRNDNITALAAGDNGLTALLASGQQLPLDIAFCSELAGRALPLVTTADCQALTQEMVANLPIAWRRDGDEAVATTADGESYRVPVSVLAQSYGAADPDEAIALADAALRSDEPVVLAAVVVAPIAMELAKALAAQVGRWVGGKILENIFPEKSLQSYFDEMYDRIKALVRQELARNEIEKIDARINGTISFIRNEYRHHKADFEKPHSKTTRELLNNKINPYINLFHTEVCQTLNQPSLRNPGFSVFLIGASVHLALYQELATIDPANHNPKESAYAKSVSSIAGDYVKMASEIWKNLSDERLKRIERRHEIYTWRNPTTGQSVYLGMKAWIDDHFEGKRIWETTNPITFALEGDKRYRAHCEAMIWKLSQGLAGEDGVDQLIARWKSLMTNPLPGI